jgi:hypothetical protein
METTNTKKSHVIKVFGEQINVPLNSDPNPNKIWLEKTRNNRVKLCEIASNGDSCQQILFSVEEKDSNMFISEFNKLYDDYKLSEIKQV